MRDEALARCLAREEQQHGIRVNVIGPGLVDTEMGRRWARANRGVERMEELSAISPFGRVGQPGDIANLCAFLVSEEGGYISGQVIYVDGGGGAEAPSASYP